MNINKDLHTFQTVNEIKASDAGNNLEDVLPIGFIISTFIINRIDDIINLNSRSGYVITCEQRIKLFNTQGYSINPSSPTEYQNYPASINTLVTFSKDSMDKYDIQLLDYSPRTLNTAVSIDQSDSAANSAGTTQTRSSGSTDAQTNSFGVSTNMGIAGDVPTFGVSMNSENSTTHTKEQSNTKGQEKNSTQSTSDSDSMSIKDWGSYAYPNSDNITMSWIFGQEYPWNVLKYNYIQGSGQGITVPLFVENRLMAILPDGKSYMVCPPSELSLFGVDFKMSAKWKVFPKSETADEDLLDFVQNLSFCLGSHGLNSGTKEADQSTEEQLTLSLSLTEMNSITTSGIELGKYGLDAIKLEGSAHCGVIGFIKEKFSCPPLKGQAFKIFSESNDLLIIGKGFGDALSTDFSYSNTPELNIYFKILDSNANCTLFMKHWKTGSASVKMSVKINDADPIVKHIDSTEGGSGDNNLSSIDLRNKDYSSIDYCDYLNLGFNTITISYICDEGTDDDKGYELKALAIEGGG